jgi:hypothetical protein
VRGLPCLPHLQLLLVFAAVADCIHPCQLSLAFFFQHRRCTSNVEPSCPSYPWRLLCLRLPRCQMAMRGAPQCGPKCLPHPPG